MRQSGPARSAADAVNQMRMKNAYPAAGVGAQVEGAAAFLGGDPLAGRSRSRLSLRAADRACGRATQLCWVRG